MRKEIDKNKKIQLEADKFFSNQDFLKARTLYNQIIKNDPSNDYCNFQLLIISLLKDDFNESLSLLEKKIKNDPENFDKNFILGNSLIILGKDAKALKYFEKALSINVNSQIVNSLSSLYWRLGEKDRALSIIMDYKQSGFDAEIQTNLSMMHFENKEYLLSVEAASSAILLTEKISIIYLAADFLSKSLYFLEDEKISEKNFIIYSALERIFSFGIEFHNFRRGLSKVIFEEKFKNISDNEKSIFYEKYPLLKSSASEDNISLSINISDSIFDNDIFMSVITSPIYASFLELNLVTYIEAESIFTKLRTHLLKNIKANNLPDTKEITNFLISLSIQNEFNGYIWNINKEEYNFLEIIKKRIHNAIKKNVCPDLFSLIIYGCYFPIKEEEKIFRYLDKNKKVFPKIFQKFINIHINIPNVLKAESKTIKSIGSINDSTSIKVKKMYESYPFPRWKAGKSKIEYTNNDSFRSKLKNKELDNFLSMKDNKEILIAGCGTGKEAIYMAQEFKNSNITAIDLSLGSLSYAKKKAKDIGVNNLNFFHCDILNVKSLNKNFDIINCSGVLHHMDCPEDGLKSLIGSLKNSGIMNIGLYSRIARERISKGRDIIKSLNLENNREDIRKFRDLVKNELHEFKQFLNIRDFFSYYEVQDLLFHPREVLFDLIEIEKLLKDNNLKFIEFDQKYNEVKKLYQNNFPEDAQLSSLENWNSFEINFPDTFLGMYQFYIRKIH